MFNVSAVQATHTILTLHKRKKRNSLQGLRTNSCRLLLKQSFVHLYCLPDTGALCLEFYYILNGLICQYFFSDDVLLFVILLSVDDFILGGACKLSAVKGGTCSACLALDCSRLACIIAVIGGILNPPCVSPEQLTYWGACFCSIYLV